MGKSNTNFKRAGYVASAVALTLASAPLVPAGSVFAAEPCTITAGENYTYTLENCPNVALYQNLNGGTYDVVDSANYTSNVDAEGTGTIELAAYINGLANGTYGFGLWDNGTFEEYQNWSVTLASSVTEGAGYVYNVSRAAGAAPFVLVENTWNQIDASLFAKDVDANGDGTIDLTAWAETLDEGDYSIMFMDALSFADLSETFTVHIDAVVLLETMSAEIVDDAIELTYNAGYEGTPAVEYEVAEAYRNIVTVDNETGAISVDENHITPVAEDVEITVSATDGDTTLTDTVTYTIAANYTDVEADFVDNKNTIDANDTTTIEARDVEGVVYTYQYDEEAGIVVSRDGEVSVTDDFFATSDKEIDIIVNGFVPAEEEGDEILLQSKTLTLTVKANYNNATVKHIAKFLEVGESFEVTDTEADGWEVKANPVSMMPYGPMVRVMSIGGDSAEEDEEPVSPVTVEAGEDGKYIITVNVAGNYNVRFFKGNIYTTDAMVNAVEFSETDDPSLNEVIDNFKAAMKGIEAAMNGEEGASTMAEAFENYMTAMRADSEKFWGDDESEKMWELARTMSRLMDGSELVVEPIIHEYTGEDDEYIEDLNYYYGIDYTTVFDKLAGILSDLGYNNTVKFYEVDMAVFDANADEEDREPISWLNNLTEEKTIMVEVEGPAAGFGREFVVVRAHFEGWQTDENGDYVLDDNGERIPVFSYEVLENVSYDEETGMLSFSSDKFSTFAISYLDYALPKAPNTGAEVKAEGVAATSNVSLAVVTAIAAITMAGAAVFAKRK